MDLCNTRHPIRGRSIPGLVSIRSLLVPRSRSDARSMGNGLEYTKRSRFLSCPIHLSTLTSLPALILRHIIFPFSYRSRCEQFNTVKPFETYHRSQPQLFCSYSFLSNTAISPCHTKSTTTPIPPSQAEAAWVTRWSLPKSEVSPNPSEGSKSISRSKLIRAHQPPIPSGNHPSSSTIEAARSTTKPGRPTGINNAGNSPANKSSEAVAAAGPSPVQSSPVQSSPVQFGWGVPFIRARLQIPASYTNNGTKPNKSEAAIDKNTKCHSIAFRFAPNDEYSRTPEPRWLSPFFDKTLK